jgi:hypothetical protein
LTIYHAEYFIGLLQAVSYLSNLVERVDVLNVFHNCELIVDVQLVDVFDHCYLSSLISDSTGSLTFRWKQSERITRASRVFLEDSRTFERAESTEERVLMTFFLERTELALLSNCVLLCSESELSTMTSSGGGCLAGAFLSCLGACLAGRIAAF